MKRIIFVLSLCLGLSFLAIPVWAQEETDQTAELAKKLSSPVASLISVPLQSNWDFGIGPEKATRYTLNIPPVIPSQVGGRV
jgi:hypothetical protein